jgi:hypothetical protein
MFTMPVRNFIQLFFVLLFVCPTYASKHHRVNTFQDVKLKISQKYGNNLKGVLVAIDLDKTLVDINEKEEAVLIDPFAPEFIKFILDNKGDILFLTARSYKNGGNIWGIADVSAIDGGQSLKLVEQNWKKHFRSQKIGYSEKKGIIFVYESPLGYPEDVKMNSLFNRGILFSRDREEIPCKGLCLHKFIKLTSLSHIHTVILIDDQEGYLDEFHYCFSKEKSDTASVNVETYHFIN